MRLATRMTALTAGACCVASCVATSPTPGVGTLGPADTSRPLPVSAERSVAVAFTASRDGQLDTVTLVASRSGQQSVFALAYLITPNDPANGGQPAVPAASGGGEPGCWGSLPGSALSSSPRVLTIFGYACGIRAHHTYWVQLGTVTGSANLYPSRDRRAATIATRPHDGAAWERSASAGQLEVAAIIR